MTTINYAGSFHYGNQDLLQTTEEYQAFFGEIYHWYKEKLNNYLETNPFKDLTFEPFFERFRNLYIKEREQLKKQDSPITFERLDGLFKMNVYDPILGQIVERLREVDQERTYFMNYVKKRQWQVTDQFWQGLWTYGEVRVNEINSPYAEKLIPIDFVEKCQLKVVR
ncbi:hypothetical protein [Enterococcus sp. DIV0187]|uniref:hypothetical protein n=1 Tax=Enterococcus sp. DIV0187 TaxID=2774644 RepID=UPI003F263486